MYTKIANKTEMDEKNRKLESKHFQIGESKAAEITPQYRIVKIDPQSALIGQTAIRNYRKIGSLHFAIEKKLQFFFFDNVSDHCGSETTYLQKIYVCVYLTARKCAQGRCQWVRVNITRWPIVNKQNIDICINKK